MATKRTTKKAETTTAAKKTAAKEAPVKAASAAPVEEAAEAAKTEAVKETAEETVVKKAAKAVAKKPAAAKKPATRKTAEKKAVESVNTEVYVQFMGREIASKDIVLAAKKAWTEATGKKESDIKELQVYIKLEENKAYYVVNGESEGLFIEL